MVDRNKSDLRNSKMRIAICGTGRVFQELMVCGLRENVEVMGLYDNDPQKWGRLITVREGDKIIEKSIEPMDCIIPASLDRVLITTVNGHGIEDQLSEQGIEYTRIDCMHSSDMAENYDILCRFFKQEDIKMLID